MLAPGALPTPLDSLIGARHWTRQTLRETTEDGGLLALLPPASTAPSVYSDLASLTPTTSSRRCAVLTPWEAPTDTPTPLQQARAIERLLRAGFSVAAVLPPQLVPLIELVSVGPSLYSHRSPDSSRPLILLLSWTPTPEQLASAITGLGSLAAVRASPANASEPPLGRECVAVTWREGSAPLQHPVRRSPVEAADVAAASRLTESQSAPTDQHPWQPWHLAGLPEPSRNGSAAEEWLGRLNQTDHQVTQVVGNASRIDTIINSAAVLSALRPEEYLFPHLLDPLPEDCALGSWTSSTYLGAALDDDAQPDPAASCYWFQTTTLRSLAAGIVPSAIHDVISPWLQRLAQSRPRQQPGSSGALPHRRPVVAPSVPAPTNPVFASGAPQPVSGPLPTTHSPAGPLPLPTPPRSAEAAHTLHASAGEPRRPHRNPSVTLVVTILRAASTFWARRTALNRDQRAARGLLSPAQRARAARRRAGGTRHPATTTPAVVSQPPPAPQSHHTRAQPECESASAVPAPPLPSRYPPESPRVRHPGRDPDTPEPLGCRGLEAPL